jgi:glycosyltransferase involved in cell wall biosynthesis
MKERRLLAINWEMPPLSGPRAVQVSRTLKHLVPLGWHSWAVCFGPRSGRYNQDAQLAARLRVPHGVTVVPVPSLEERLFFRALWRVAPPLKMMPDEKWVWIAAATRTAQRLAEEREFAVIVSFGQPWSDHLIGRRVQRSTGLPWVAHFSDPWVDSPYLRGPGWQRRMCQRMETDVIEHADALVFVNAQTADRVMRKYPEAWRRKAHVVPHGFDPDNRVPAVSSRSGSRLHLVYTGRFYGEIRTPAPLLRAIAKLAEQYPVERDLRVTFIGTTVRSHQDLASRLGLDDIVTFTGRLPYGESARRAADADVLLVIDAPAEESLFLPSKLVEYLPMNKPILALTPVRGASADLVRSLGYPVIAPDDEPAIASAVEGLIAAKRDGRLAASADHERVAARYDIRRTTASLAEILARCVSG